MGSLASLAILLGSIVLIVFLIMKVRLSAFLALIVACMFLGFVTGMPLGRQAAVPSGIRVMPKLKYSERDSMTTAGNTRAGDHSLDRKNILKHDKTYQV